MAEQVKIDVLLNYIFDNKTIKDSIANINTMMLQKVLSPRNTGLMLFGNLKEAINQEKIAIEHINNVFKNNLAQLRHLNKGGFLKHLIKDPYSRRINANKEELTEEAQRKTNQQIQDEANFIEAEKTAWKENEDFDRKTAEEREEEELRRIDEASKLDYEAWKESIKNEKDKAKQMAMQKSYDTKMNLLHSQALKDNIAFDKQKAIEEKRREEEIAQQFMSEEQRKIKMNLLHSKALEENKKRDEALRKKTLKALAGEFGSLGIAGFIASRVLGYASKAANLINKTAQASLSYERTISGGAGIGLVAGIAAYQRAGLNGNAYQNFRRGLQYSVGQLKLGKGNAAPFMMWGINALSKNEDIAKQIIERLKTLPEDMALVMGQDFGLDWDTVVAARSGELDKKGSIYSEEAMKQWAEVAKNINEVVTDFKVFMYNTFGRILYDAAGSKQNFLLGLSGGISPVLNPFANMLMNLNVVFRKNGQVEVESVDINNTPINYNQTSMQI